MPINIEVLDQILKDYEKPEDLLDERLIAATDQSTRRTGFERQRFFYFFVFESDIFFNPAQSMNARVQNRMYL